MADTRFTDAGGDDEIRFPVACPEELGDSSELRATDDSNYSFRSELRVQSVAVAPMSDLVFDWSALTHDLVGHAIDPERDVRTVLLLHFRGSEIELIRRLNDNDLATSEVIGFLELQPTLGQTRARLSEFGIAGEVPPADDVFAQFDPSKFEPDEHAYALVLVEGDVIGDARAYQTFHLDADEVNTEVQVNSNSSTLEYQVQLGSSAPILVPLGQMGVFDWSDLALDAQGRPLDAAWIDEVILAHYPRSIASLEEDFLDWLEVADGVWRREISPSTQVDLRTLLDETGDSPQTLGTDGSWVVALMCSACGSLAPVYLTELTPCEPR